MTTCSFCGRDRMQCQHLITDRDAAICGECVLLCNEIIAESKAKRGKPEPAEAVPSPKPFVPSAEHAACV